MTEEINYKLGEVKECDFDIISLLNFIDWFAPTKEINDDLTNKVRYLANQISYTEKRPEREERFLSLILLRVCRNFINVNNL